MPLTIQAGGTLWDAAQRLLGDGSRWRELLAPSGLPADFNPRTLQIGTVIRTAAEVQQAAPRPAPSRAAPAPTPAAPTPSPTSVPVQPGLQHEEFLLGIGLQEMIANQLAELDRARQADVRRLQEAQLGANPADFVAYELYRRSLEEQGFTPTSPVRSDIEIQDLFGLALGLEDGVGLGMGQFGVELPATGDISRSELRAFSPTDVGILSSFLRGGVKTGEGFMDKLPWSDASFQGINPEDFFTELEEGLVPVLQPQRTQFRF